MDTGITELVNVAHEAAWLPWAVQYFFLIGLSAGCFFLSLPAFAFGKAHWEKIGRLMLVGALSTGIAAPIALLADLHQPGRFYNFYLHFTHTSWMSWGAFFIPAYVGLLLVYAWLVYRPHFAGQAKAYPQLAGVYRLLSGPADPGKVRAVGIAAALATALVVLYTGAEVAVIKARFLWNTPLLPLQFLCTALAGAAGLALVLNRALGLNDKEVEQRLNRLLALFLAAVIAVGLAWTVLAVSGLSTTHAAALDSVTSLPQWWQAVGWAIALTVVPLIVILVKPKESGWVMGLVALITAWLFRWAVFMGGQAVPKTGAGLYDYVLPAGPEGLLGIIGTAGLWLFLMIMIATFVPWQGNPPDFKQPRHSDRTARPVTKGA